MNVRPEDHVIREALRLSHYVTCRATIGGARVQLSVLGKGFLSDDCFNVTGQPLHGARTTEVTRNGTHLTLGDLSGGCSVAHIAVDV